MATFVPPKWKVLYCRNFLVYTCFIALYNSCVNNGWMFRFILFESIPLIKMKKR